jgi:hypothetical protein
MLLGRPGKRPPTGYRPHNLIGPKICTALFSQAGILQTALCESPVTTIVSALLKPESFKPPFRA